MTEQEQRIAIAEACGWTWSILPDYLHDLNAMREAIMTQPSEIQKAMRFEVWRLSSQMTVLPPASVFAEALLRVLNKWKD